jgi:MFS transporter, ACS family, solute carrier family 17 (sodium-dependent inorganic phosphate cotransporter), other
LYSLNVSNSYSGDTLSWPQSWIFVQVQSGTSEGQASSSGSVEAASQDVDKAQQANGAGAHVQASGYAEMRGWPKRFTIVALCFVAFMLCNMDRVNMSIAVLPMQKEFGWNSQTLGIVQSSFFWYGNT